MKLEFFNTCAELPDAEPDNLFDRFFRGDKARTQKNGGYGIGLSVARSIVEANRGTIDAEFADNGVKFKIKYKKYVYNVDNKCRILYYVSKTIGRKKEKFCSL